MKKEKLLKHQNRCSKELQSILQKLLNKFCAKERLSSDDQVVGAIVLSQEASILTVTENGYGKRSAIEDYRKTGRAGKGVKNIKISEKTGDVVSTINVRDGDMFVVTTKKGIAIRTTVKNIRVMSRATSGVRIINLKTGDRVSDIAKLEKAKEEVAEKSE